MFLIPIYQRSRLFLLKFRLPKKRYNEKAIEEGEKLTTQKSYQEALDFYQKALELNPDYSRSHLNLGVIYEKKGDTESAIREYIAALKGNPDYLTVYYNLGELFEREGNIAMAIKTYKEAYRKNPGNGELAARIRSLEDRYGGR